MRYKHKETGLILNNILELRRFLRKDFPDILLPSTLSDAQLALFGLEKLVEEDEGYGVFVKLDCRRLLAESDWIMLADSPISNQTEWAAYRQLLRNGKITTKPELVYKKSTTPNHQNIEVELQNKKLPPQFIADLRSIDTMEQLVHLLNTYSLML